MIDPRKIWSSSQLPTLPTVALKLLDLSRSPDTQIADVVALIKSDPAIAAKILKATNSTFFGFASKVTSIDRAVPLLGTTVVTSLALSFSLVEAAMQNGPLAESYSEFWLQSVVHAAAAESLGKLSRNGLGCEYFLAGLLLDLGRLAMLKTIPDQYLPVLKVVRDEGRDLAQLEQGILGFNHAEIGFELMRNWQLPEMLAHAVRLHHSPLDVIRAEHQCPDFELVKALVVAAVIGDYFCSKSKGDALRRMRQLTSELYRFSEPQLEEFLTQLKTRIDSTADLFAVNTEHLGHPSDIMAEASEQLIKLTLREHAASTQAIAQIEQENRELLTRNEQLQQQALHDPLTKIYNRSFFDEALAKETSRCCRSAGSLSVIFIDVDRFKLLNDTYGHQFGDAVLKRVATSIGEVLRSSDVLARFGGEEFVVLVSQPTEKGLEKVAERIRARIEDEHITFGTDRVPVTVSVGAALKVPTRQDEHAARDIVAVADEAMYEAKQSGRNRVCIRLMLNEAERRLMRLVTQRRFSRWLVGKKLLPIVDVSAALLECQPDRTRIGDLARQRRMLTPEQVGITLIEHEKRGLRFGETALELGFLDENQLAELLALQQENPTVLASVLVRRGQLTAQACQGLLRDYLQDIASPAVACAH